MASFSASVRPSPGRAGLIVAALVAAPLATLLAVAPVAQASAVVNAVETDTPTLVMEVDASTLVGYRILPTVVDGVPVCNADDGTPTTMSFILPASFGVFPTSLVFGSCGTWEYVTYTASTVGSFTLGVVTSDGGGAVFDVSAASTTAFVVPKGDTTPPRVDAPADVTKEAEGPAGAVHEYVFQAYEPTDGIASSWCEPESGSVFPLGRTMVTCIAIDKHSNVGLGFFNVTVVDTTPPRIFGMPASMTLTPTEYAVATWTLPRAVDIVDATPTVWCDPASGSRFPAGTTTVTCSARDDAGNKASRTFTVTIVDAVTPSLWMPPDIVLAATGPSGARASFTPIPFDFIDPSPVVTCVPASNSTFPAGATLVTCTATDSSGNSASGTLTVTVTDAPPELIVPAPIVREATGPAGAVVHFVASASDLMDGPLVPVCTPASGSTFPLGVTTVRCTATDSVGNVVAGTFTVTVRDTTKPTLVVPPDVVLEATGPTGASHVFAASATDGVSGALAVACSPASGTTFPLGVTLVTCSAADAAGNGVSGSFRVTVRDTTPPVPPALPNVTLRASGAPAALPLDFLAPDIVSGLVPGVCAPAGPFALGVHVVTCTFTDAAGNAASTSFRVEVLAADDVPPTLVVPEDFTVSATGPEGAVATWSASAHDDRDGPLVPTCAPMSGSLFPLGLTTVVCTATDSAGNSVSKSFTVTVVDDAPPVVTVPALVVVEATGPDGAPARWTASAYDVVDGPLEPACSDASGWTYPLGDTTVTCTARDLAGNEASASFVVRVVDTTPPTLIATDVVLEATSPAGAALAAFGVTARDLVDTTLPIVCTSAPGTFALGVTRVACTATDDAGNRGAANFTITVRDTIAPTLALPAPPTLEATGPGGVTWSYATSATDAVDTTPTVACAPASGSIFPLGATTVTCTATDDSGNARVATFVVRVVDTRPPVVTVPSAIAQSAPGPAAVSFASSAVDVVSGATAVTCAPASGSVFAFGNTTVTCTSTDAAGNVGTASFVVTLTLSASTCKVTEWLPPVTARGHNKGDMTSFKQGSTIPLKLRTSCEPACDLDPRDHRDDDRYESRDSRYAARDGDRYESRDSRYAARDSDRYESRESRYGGRDDDHDDDDDDDDHACVATAPRLFVAKLVGGVPVDERAGTSRSHEANLFAATGNHWQYNLDTRVLGKGDWRLRVVFADGASATLDLRLR